MMPDDNKAREIQKTLTFCVAASVDVNGRERNKTVNK